MILGLGVNQKTRKKKKGLTNQKFLSTTNNIRKFDASTTFHLFSSFSLLEKKKSIGMNERKIGVGREFFKWELKIKIERRAKKG